MGGGIVIRIYFFFFRLIYLLEADLESVFDLPRSANRNFLTVVYTESFTPSFRQTLNAHLNQLHDGVGFSLIVADSALYTAKTLHDLGDFPWITRVPETIGGTRELILAPPLASGCRRDRNEPTLYWVQLMATLNSVGWWFTPKPHTGAPNKRSTSNT